MKKVLITAAIFVTLIGCGTKEKRNDEASANETVAPSLPPLENADVTFMKKGKEFAKVDFEDTETGIRAIFKAKKLQKGQYILNIEEACKAPPRAKFQAPRKMFMMELGQLTTTSGNVSSEYNLAGYSVGDRFLILNEKSVSLNKKSKKGNLVRIACGKIIKR
jgi:hypothetical protein